MVTLFIDTANKYLLLAVIKDNQIISHMEKELDITLSSSLVLDLKKVIDDALLTPNDINNIMVVNGPGSFTGTRMGVTVAKTYAWALKKKIITISELEVMASTAFNGDYIMPLIDARHNAVYAGLYDQNGNKVLDDAYLPLTEWLKKVPNKKITVTTYDELYLDYEALRPTIDLLKIVSKHIGDEGINPHQVNPDYLKKTEAEENLLKEV